MKNIDYLFEVSWEVCNKVGGIHTVLASKALTLQNKLGNNYMLIGPLTWNSGGLSDEFTEDKSLYKTWRFQVQKEGLIIKIGRWNVPGNPIAILVDFSTFFDQKDQILTEMWEWYGVDSITGGWDYVEPVMFGYAAAKVIESFYNYYVTAHDVLVTHFHEWMTQSGMLYLKKKVPQAATVFTTHATVLGRTLAGNGLPLYSEALSLNPEEAAHKYNVMAKHSLESKAAQNTDAFTTVSNITATECQNFLNAKPHAITYNGFEKDLVPPDDELEEKRKTAKKYLKSVAEALLNTDLPDDTIYISISGRYEVRNKGIDLFIKSLGELKKANPEKTVVAYFLIPSNNTGPRQEILNNIYNKHDQPIENCYLTHHLYDEKNDPIINLFKQEGLTNSHDDNVKVIFVPSYLNGNDGIFNMHYYDLLTGFDLTVYPSYYEPWGYTPLESIAFHIPTITSSLAGFARWIMNLETEDKEAVYIVERNDFNDDDAKSEIAKIIGNFIKLPKEKIEDLRKKARNLSQKALWQELIENYYKAFDIAIEKAHSRYDLYSHKTIIENIDEIIEYVIEKPQWKKVLVKTVLPDNLLPLNELAYNVWWSWNEDAKELFKSINPEKWQEANENPIILLEELNYDELIELSKNKEFIAKLDAVYARYKDYMEKREKPEGPRIAYFSMEFGLHHTIKLYSGGLGILAGDYIKQASDDNKNLFAVSLMYRYGYFDQEISANGYQVEIYEPQKFSHLPITPVRDNKGNWVIIKIPFPGRFVYAKIWELQVGSVSLYLLDTDIEENNEHDRKITHHLYGGDKEYRLEQEILLGIGGVRLINELKLNPDIYHLNEGHAAFINLERLINYMTDSKFSFNEAVEIVRSTSLFTTHTPVPAGHDTFKEELLRKYLGFYIDRLGIGWDKFIMLGRSNPLNYNEDFSMSVFAVKLSQEVNGVSKIHGEVSQKMFANIWHHYFPSELHIGYVTNGVHFDTWIEDKWRKLYCKYAKVNNSCEILQKHGNWDFIYDTPDKEIWEIKKENKKLLIDYIKNYLHKNISKHEVISTKIIEITSKLNHEAFTIGFARRFATYKRAHLLFKNLDRLSKLVNNPKYPVQIIFAGKAHPADKAGKDLIKMIYEVSLRPEFIGKIIFLEDYNIKMAKLLVSGVDLWLNTPTRPLEASGTSGQKAVMNGVPNLSVLDGWWYEGYHEGAGWALPKEKTFKDQEVQDQFDAETIYQMLENEIIPKFYNTNSEGVPAEWTKVMKNTIAEIAPHFTTKRMMSDYYDKFYNKRYDRSRLLKENNYQKLYEITKWKSRTIINWQNIEITNVKITDTNQKPLQLGEKFTVEITLKLRGLKPNEIGAEVIFGRKEKEEVKDIIHKFELELKHFNKTDNTATYYCSIPASKAGVYDYAIRIYPQHPLLPYKHELNIVKWI